MLAILVLGIAFGLHRLIDPDLFQQVAVGRQLLAHPLSFGRSVFIAPWPDFPYVEDKWLPSIVAALADRLAGAHGLMLYELALTTAVAGSWYLMMRCWGASARISVVAVALGLLASAYRLEPRPDTWSHALLGLVLALVSGRVPYRVLRWALPALFVVWVNVHGYFVNGLLVVGSAWVATAVTGPWDERGPTVRQWGILMLWSLAGCLLHPQGIRALANPVSQLLALQGDSTLRASVIEFSSSLRLFRGAGAGWLALLGGSLAGAAAVSIAGWPRRPLQRQGLALLVLVPWLARLRTGSRPSNTA